MREKKKTAQVYVAGSLRHVPMSWWPIYEKIGKVVEEAGMEPYIPHIDTVEAIDFPKEEIHNPKMDEKVAEKIFNKDIETVENSDLIIAEVTYAALGTGIEIGWALTKNKKIICLVKNGTNLSSMIRGASKKGMIKLIEYDNEEEALNRLGEMLREMKI